MQRILEGQQILEEKGGDSKGNGLSAKFPMPPPTTEGKKNGLDIAFNNAMTNNGVTASDLFRGRDKTQEAAWSAYRAIYAAEASRRGITSGILDEDIAEDAAKAVLGNVAQYNSTAVSIPSGMDPTRFAGVMTNAIKDAMTANGYGPEDIKALRAYGLQEVGDMLGTGQYKIIDGMGAPFRTKDRKAPIIIDLKDYTRSLAPPPTVFARRKGNQISFGSPDPDQAE